MNIRGRNLCFGYGQRPVLSGVDMDVPSGQFCALLGANGAGKSTLLRCINGILKPGAGSVHADDTDLLALSPKQRARLVGYVPQSAQAENSALNVYETVLSGRVPHMRGKLSDEDHEIALSTLESLDLGAFATRQLSQISGGERQRVFIARAVAQRPRILLLDEPTNNLDMHFEQQTLELVSLLCKRWGMTVIAVLHALNAALAYADHAVLLDGGNVLDAGPPQHVLSKQHIHDVFAVEVGFAPMDGIDYVIPRRGASSGVGTPPLP